MTLLTTLLRLHFGLPAEGHRVVTGDLAARVLSTAVRNKVLSFIVGALPDAADQAFFVQYKAEIMRRSNEIILACLRLSSLLYAAGIDHVFVKGPLRQRDLYGDFFIRPSSDVDILVSRESFRAARNILYKDGYVVLSPSIWWNVALGEQTLVKRGHPDVAVDLHYRLDQPGLPRPRSTEAFLRTAQQVACRGGRLPILSSSEATVLDLIGFGKALFNRQPSGSYLCDLYAALMADFPRSVNSFLAIAAAQRLDGVAKVALAALSAVFGVGVPGAPTPKGPLAQVSASIWRTLVLMPDDAAVAWPRRRELLWAFCDGEPVRNLAELGRLGGSEILRRLVERGPRRDLVE